MEELREKLADLEHDRWSRWMRYMFKQGQINEDGSWTMPAESVNHWDRQMRTPYADLSEKEKDSDRKEADNTLSVFYYGHQEKDIPEPIPPPDVPAGTYQKAPSNLLFFFWVILPLFFAWVFFVFVMIQLGLF